MKIVDILSEDLIIADLQAGGRDEVLDEMVRCVVRSHPEIEHGPALRVLLDRERIGSTGIGGGLAIPHARLAALSAPVACFARSVAGVDFRALDGKPTHLFLTLLAPVGSAGFHLKALARASRMLKDEAFRNTLLAADGTNGIWRAIAAKDEALSAQP